MEEVISELQQHAESVPVPFDLPSDDDLLSVEESLLLQLPKEYREFLATVSDLVIGKLEPCTAADPSSHTYIPEVAATTWDQGLPRHLIPICIDSNNIYAMDPDGLVELWLNGTRQAPTWETIWDWAMQVWLRTAL